MLVFANGIYFVSLNETGKLNSTDNESPEVKSITWMSPMTARIPVILGALHS